MFLLTAGKPSLLVAAGIMKALSDCRLYGILDLNYVPLQNAICVAETMIEGGVDLIQLRAKQCSLETIVDLARQLHEITSRSSIPLIVNDYAEIARQVPIEGAHVGQDDDSVAIAREKAGRALIVGKSTHSLAQAKSAQNEGADYIGFGPIFATPTKPDYKPIGLDDIKQVHVDVTLPIFCIGGIKIDNLGQVIAAGARRVAIVSGLLKATDIAEYARACKKLLTKSSPL
jgi:thiamine-phosphate pyrophosphorylase